MSRSPFIVFTLALLLNALVSMGQGADRDDRLLDALINHLTHSERYIRTQALKTLNDMGHPVNLTCMTIWVRKF